MEHGPTGAYLSAKLCEWCERPSRYPICPQCLGAPPAREPFAKFLPVEPAITDPAPRKVDPGAVTRKRATVLGLPVGTPRHEVDRAWASRERPPCKLPGCSTPWAIGGWCRRHAKRCKALGLPYTVAPEGLAEAIRVAEAARVERARVSIVVASAARKKQ